MQLISTRQGVEASPCQAVLRGLAPDGGLFVPEAIPHFSKEELTGLLKLPYPALAARVIGAFFDEIPSGTLLEMCEEAYASFAAEDVVPLRPIGDDTFALELFHGPTLAFKDVALQLLPLLLAYSAQHTKTAQKVLILVATSGDTGKAALCGFADKKDTAICVFYPESGVSDAQKLQMQTQQGNNVGVFAVKGNFDDCQRGVKRLMGDGDFVNTLCQKGYVLSSANSINFGRLVPQIAYYFKAYADLVHKGEVPFGDSVHFTVPTGNFGNILAGWMAKQMGLPVGKLIGASNRNHVLDIFYRTGVYKAGLTLVPTTSPSMDILISSNLERLLFALSGNDGERVQDWMQSQKEGRDFEVGDDVKKRLKEDFLWGWADDGEAGLEIKETFEQSGVLLDPHSAVGAKVTKELRQKGDLFGKTVLLCTASPYKFASDVRMAVCGEKADVKSDVNALSELLGQEPPKGITDLFDAKVLHDETLEAEDMKQAVLHRIEAL